MILNSINLSIDEYVVNMLSFLAVSKIFQGNKFYLKNIQNKINKVKVNNMLLINLDNIKSEYSLLVIDKTNQSSHIHLVKHPDEEMPRFIPVRQTTDDKIKRHGRVDNRKFFKFFRKQVRKYVFEHPNKLNLLDQRFTDKNVRLFNPTITGTKLVKDEVSLIIDYGEENVIFKEIDPFKKRIGILKDENGIDYMLAIRNGEILCYEWKELESTVMRVMPMIDSSFYYKNALHYTDQDRLSK